MYLLLLNFSRILHQTNLFFTFPDARREGANKTSVVMMNYMFMNSCRVLLKLIVVLSTLKLALTSTNEDDLTPKSE